MIAVGRADPDVGAGRLAVRRLSPEQEGHCLLAMLIVVAGSGIGVFCRRLAPMALGKRRAQ